MMRNPRLWRPSGTDPPALFGSREAPTTAITVAASSISRPVLLMNRASPTATPIFLRLPQEGDDRRLVRAHAEQRLAGGNAADLLPREPVSALFPLRHRARDVRSDEHVGCAP